MSPDKTHMPSLESSTKSLRDELRSVFESAFTSIGLGRQYGAVDWSQRPDLGQFQCNGALGAARTARRKPMDIAETVAESVRKHRDIFSAVTVVPPGFINITLSDEFLATFIGRIAADPRCGCPTTVTPERIVIDFGGPNIAKPMHVGHLRSSILGDSLQRLFRFVGHDVVGDIHLGDWGTPIGMLITELRRRNPELPYFSESTTYPTESPITIDDLQEMYVVAAARCKEDPQSLAEAQQATVELQRGHSGYRALWRHFVETSCASLREDFSRLGVTFTVWGAESDYNERIPDLVNRLKHEGKAVPSQGAIVIPVARPGDDREIPPLILLKADGGYLYATTDLATIEERVNDRRADKVLYVVDNRQALHFQQLFRAAEDCGIAREGTLEHIAFGTMNGADGRPFRTRAGGVMRLRDLIAMVHEVALQRMQEAGIGSSRSPSERDAIATQVAIATLKYGDLMHERTSDYVFDVARFTKFEGATGPYLQYAAVRIKSIFRKGDLSRQDRRLILPPASAVERDLMLCLTRLPDAISTACEFRAPNALCQFAFELSNLFNKFYHEHHILGENDSGQRSSWLGLADLCAKELELVLELLGIATPEQM